MLEYESNDLIECSNTHGANISMPKVTGVDSELFQCSLTSAFFHYFVKSLKIFARFALKYD